MNERSCEHVVDAEREERREWIQPAVTRLRAQYAELNVGAIDDGVDTS